MKKLKIKFTKCIQDSQIYGSTNEHMMSRIFMEVDGKQYTCDIRQPHGSNFSFENDPIEVDPPANLQPLMNYEQFRNAVEEYYRNLFGKEGAFVKIAAMSAKNIRMKNNTANSVKEVEIDMSGFEGGW